MARSEGSGVCGDIAWLDGSKYDEAILLLDARLEDDSRRVLCRVVDERAGCEVDCWTYLGVASVPRGTS